VTKPSGNQYFDDSCVQAVKTTGRVPPPPAVQAWLHSGFRRQGSDPLRRNMTKCPFTRYGLITTALVLSAAFPIHAQPAESGAGESDELPRIVISDPNRDLSAWRCPMPPARRTWPAQPPRSSSETCRSPACFACSTRFRSRHPAERRHGFSSALWSEVGAQGVAKMSVTQQGSGLALEGRLYQVGRGESAVMSKTYRGGELRALVHAGPTTSSPSSPASAACSGPHRLCHDRQEG